MSNYISRPIDRNNSPLQSSKFIIWHGCIDDTHYDLVGEVVGEGSIMRGNGLPEVAKVLRGAVRTLVSTTVCPETESDVGFSLRSISVFLSWPI